MNIIIGKTAGFCYGVKRAVEGSDEQVKKYDKVYCLGELVHNKQVIDDLERKGMKFVETLDEIEENNARVIIRAHGVSNDVYEEAQKRNFEIIDYTCPNVLRIHKISEQYQKEGYYIFLTGVENHPETIGIISYCGKNYTLIQDEKDVELAIENFKKSKIKKLLLISQTTYSVKKFDIIRDKIKRELSDDIQLVIKNTICLASETRQKETKELSSKVDSMIIIGGKNSSNTKKLYEVASENCKNTFCIEIKDDLDISVYENVDRLGLMAGASTPQKSIDEVVQILRL